MEKVTLFTINASGKETLHGTDVYASHQYYNGRDAKPVRGGSGNQLLSMVNGKSGYQLTLFKMNGPWINDCREIAVNGPSIKLHIKEFQIDTMLDDVIVYFTTYYSPK